MDNNTSRSGWPAHISLRGACEDLHALTTEACEGVAISNRSPKVASVAAQRGAWYIEGSPDNRRYVSPRPHTVQLNSYPADAAYSFCGALHTALPLIHFSGRGRRLNNASGLRIWVPTKVAASEIAGISTPLINVR
jgi:hypothetical protein